MFVLRFWFHCLRCVHEPPHGNESLIPNSPISTLVCRFVPFSLPLGEGALISNLVEMAAKHLNFYIFAALTAVNFSGKGIAVAEHPPEGGGGLI